MKSPLPHLHPHDLAKKQILVTGGAGFIGSALIRELNRRGFENIVVVDYLRDDERWKNLAPLRFTDYLEADTLLRYIREGSHFFRSIHTVFHFGANSSTSETDARHLIENNFEYTKLLCYVARQNDARFVYASSAATYGDGSAGMSDDPAADLHRLRPLNIYGYSKHLFDLYAARQNLFKEVVGLKFFNVFGPNEGHKGDMRSMVHRAFHQVRENGIIHLFRSEHPDYADGEQQRDFLYVKDAARMAIHLACQPRTFGLFNLGSGQARTWNELARAVFAALGQPANISYIDLPRHLQGKYQYFTEADISRLRAAGYADEITPLEDAVADYVKNYLVPDRHLGDEPA